MNGLLDTNVQAVTCNKLIIPTDNVLLASDTILAQDVAEMYDISEEGALYWIVMKKLVADKVIKNDGPWFWSDRD